MVIRDISVYAVEISRKFFKNARREKSLQRSAITKIATDEGIAGFGEVDPSYPLASETLEEIIPAIQNVIRPLVRGQNPLDMAAIQGFIDSKLEDHWHAKVAVESALFDLMGKILGVPLHVLLGGKKVDRIPLIGPVGIQSTEDTVKEAVSWVEKGFAAIKLKIGLNPEEDIARMKAVRKAVGDDIILRCDANQGYSAHVALRVIRQMDDLNIQSIEQPVPAWDIEGMKRLAQTLDTPVMPDEPIHTPHDAANMIRLGAANLIKVKVQRKGGIRGAVKTLAVCEALGVQGVVGKISQLSLGAAAEIHVAAASDGVLYPGEMVGPAVMYDDIVKEPLDMSKGFVNVPDGPGFGLEIDEKKLKKYTIEVAGTSR